MSNNNGQNGRPSGAPQQQLSPPTDPRKRNIPATGSQTTQQRTRTSGSRQNDKYTAMPMTPSSPSGQEHPPLYGYVPRSLPVPQPTPQPAPPTPNVIALRDVLLMPPPPPPPPPLTNTAPPSVAPTFSCGHQIPKEFDPTQPPPILRPQVNASRKRGATDNIQAGPSSKIRQMELPDGPCTDCVQRNIRTSIYQEQSAKLEQEHKVHETNFSNRTEHVENGKLWLKSILSSRQYSLMDNFVENGWTNNLFSEPSPSSSFASFFQETPTPRQSLWDQLLEALLGGARNLNNSMTHLQPSTSREDSLLQMLSGGGRRSSAAESSLGVLLEAISIGSSSAETATTSSSPDRLQAVIEALRPAVESEQRTPSERAGGSSNGLSRLANGLPSAPLAVPAPAPYAIRPVQATAPPPARPYYTQPYPPPIPAPAPGTAPQAAPLQPYLLQQSQQPAAARPFYAPRYVPGAPQPPAPPPAQQFAPPYYAAARPPPHDPRGPPPPNQYPQFGPPYPPYYPPGPSGPSY